MNNSLTRSEIREQGIGNGFTVLNPHDGILGGNRLWFGTCNTCGEKVTQFHLDKTWNHSVPAQGISGDWTAVRDVDYCPSN